MVAMWNILKIKHPLFIIYDWALGCPVSWLSEWKRLYYNKESMDMDFLSEALSLQEC